MEGAPLSVGTLRNSSQIVIADLLACESQKNWAGLLDTYNNGQYPGAPAHCPE